MLIKGGVWKNTEDEVLKVYGFDPGGGHEIWKEPVGQNILSLDQEVSQAVQGEMVDCVDLGLNG